MRLYTNNKERTFDEMNGIFWWCIENFGEPSDDTWSYGKEPGFLGNELCDGPYDVEFIDFKKEQDATAFKLTWL